MTTILPAGVKATTGGRFDRDEHLLYFLATSPDLLLRTNYPQVLVAVNELNSKKRLDQFDRLLDNNKVLLDSGIFNLAMTHARTHNTTHDQGLAMPPEEIDGFGELWDLYGSVVTKYADRLWGVIELDQGGVANKPRTRARIEKEFGIIPMPVYHPLLDGWDYYDTIASEYDRICFGNLVKASVPVRLRLQWTAAERGRRYPYLWTHMLGVTPNQNLIGMDFRGSCDSSSWIANLRWMHSWKAFAMFQAASSYPPDMWVDVETYVGDKSEARSRNETVAAFSAYAQHLMLGTLGEDTHPWI